MHGPQYIFALQDKHYRFWRPDGSGATISAQPYLLDFAPDGWDDIGIQNILNTKYFGIDRSVTTSLKYVQDGAQILKHIFYKYGFEEPVYLVIAKKELDYVPGVSYGFWHRQIFRAQVDLTTFEHNEFEVTASTLEEGLAKYLKSNEGTVYEFPLNVPEAVTIKMDGIKLQERLNYAGVDGLELSINGSTGKQFFAPISYLNKEGDSVGIAFQNQSLQIIGPLESMATITGYSNCLLQNVNAFTVNTTVSGRLQFVCTGMTSAPPYAIRFMFLKTGMNLVNKYQYQIISTGLVVGNTYTIDFSKDIPLAQNDRLYLYAEFFGGPGLDAKIEFTPETKFSTSLKTLYQTTYIKALRPQYLFEQLINKATEGNYTADVTPYFGSLQHEDKVFTSGNGIRSIDTATIKISLNQFFDFWNSYDAVGLYDKQGKIHLNRKINLIDVNGVIDLPAPSKIKISVAKSFLFNEYETGYPEIKNESGVLNGNDEFNCKFLFSTGTVLDPKKLVRISPVKAGCYEIERIRIESFAKDTTDNKNDNDNYVIHIEPNLIPENGGIPAHYLLNRTLNPLITAGLLEPETVFNVALSPSRMVQNNEEFLHSCFYKGDFKNLHFISADKNNKMVCNGIEEKADRNIGGMKQALFIPIQADATFIMPLNLLELLDVNPLQVYRFTLIGNQYKFISLKNSVQSSSNKEQDVQLLFLADSDLKPLIEYYGG